MLNRRGTNACLRRITAEWPLALACAICSLFVAVIICRGIVAIFEVDAKDFIGAFGSIMGGIIGAVGAALAVVWQFDKQRREGRERIYKAVHSEVKRQGEVVANIALGLCTTLEMAYNSLFLNDLHSIMTMPQAEIYPTIIFEVTAIDETGDIRRFFQFCATAREYYIRPDQPSRPAMSGEIRNAFHNLQRILLPALAILQYPESRAVNASDNLRAINLINAALRQLTAQMAKTPLSPIG